MDELRFGGVAGAVGRAISCCTVVRAVNGRVLGVWSHVVRTLLKVEKVVNAIASAFEDVCWWKLVGATLASEGVMTTRDRYAG